MIETCEACGQPFEAANEWEVLCEACTTQAVNDACLLAIMDPAPDNEDTP